MGSTVFTLFDEKLHLREGKNHVVIWPDSFPDSRLESSTTGYVYDQNIRELKFCENKLEELDKEMKRMKPIDNKAIEILRNKAYYAYRRIPLAFIEIQFPEFNIPVYYEDAK